MQKSTTPLENSFDNYFKNKYTFIQPTNLTLRYVLKRNENEFSHEDSFKCLEQLYL